MDTIRVSRMRHSAAARLAVLGTGSSGRGGARRADSLRPHVIGHRLIGENGAAKEDVSADELEGIIRDGSRQVENRGKSTTAVLPDSP